MQGRLSRTKIARYAVQQLINGKPDVMRDIAAFLVDSGRVREADLVLRAIYDELEAQGIVLADVTTATELEADVEAAIAELTGARQLTLQRTVSADVLGGIRVQTPSKLLDATVARRITKLRERKI